MPLEAKYTASTRPMVSDIAARRRQHVVDFARQRIRDLLRPDLQQQAHRLIGELLGAEKPASDVSTIRNGNSAINADSAMWLAIAQPSSARNV